MRTTAVLSLLLLALLSACEGDVYPPRYRYSAQDTLTVDVTQSNRKQLVLIAVNGSITITGTPGATDISIFAVERVEAYSQADAEDGLSEIEVDVDSTDASVIVQTNQPSGSGGRNYIVNYTITVPSEFGMVVDGANGDVSIERVDGYVSVHLANGSIYLGGILGGVTATLANGNIDGQVTLPLGERLVLSTSNGEINLSIPQTTSAQFYAETGRGTVTVVGLDLKNAEIKRYRVTGTLGYGEGLVSLNVANGTIFVQGF
jgi:DUF4097 and DUF4098 domain-containing protein YvlB